MKKENSLEINKLGNKLHNCSLEHIDEQHFQLTLINCNYVLPILCSVLADVRSQYSGRRGCL